MCGFVGYFFNGNRSNNISQETLRNMAMMMKHRGPDYMGVLCHNNWGMAHNRLSIIDLHSVSNQPMNKYGMSLSYNGEIYNYKELRNELTKKGYIFETNSDTEVVLNSIHCWGEEAFLKFNGIFALAVYNELEGVLMLARDRVGIKPLYIYRKNDIILFGSEIKCFLPSNLMEKEINQSVISEFLYMNAPAGNSTMFKNVYKVEPGTFIKIKNKEFDVKKYYSLRNREKRIISDHEAIEQTKYLLSEAVKRQLVADVPLCIFLSGGIDSSAITLLASKFHSQPINTFSVEFDFYKTGSSELPRAKKVAEMGGCNHHELKIDSGNLTNVLQKLAYHHDEPFGDAANIPLYLLTEQINAEYKVVLQGDGGDELFAGYNYYSYLNSGRKFKTMAKFIVPLLNQLKIGSSKFKRFKKGLNYLTKTDLELVFSLIHGPMRKDVYSSIFSQDFKNEDFHKNPISQFENLEGKFDDVLELMNYVDLVSVLPNGFLEKVDKPTMAHSVEARVPFLDFNLVDFVLSLPMAQRMRNGEKKFLLKKALSDIVPHEILYGKKQGFGVPFEEWLRTGLKSFFIETILDGEIGKSGILNLEEIVRLKKEHDNRSTNNGTLLWNIMSFSLWYNTFMDNK